MKVFSKEMFFKENVYNCKRYCEDADVRRRVDLAEGEPVIGGQWNGWIIKESWTKEVNHPVEESGKILNTYFPNGFPNPEPKPAPEAVNCKCVMHTKKGKGRFRIIIDCDGDTTTARMLVDGHTVKKTTAKRNPADKFNWRIGAQMAFNRLWEKKKKPVVLEVKRHAKPGEWVKVVDATNDSVNDYKNGDVLQIVQYEKGFTEEAYYKCESTKLLYDDEYVVLEGYKPE